MPRSTTTPSAFTIGNSFIHPHFWTGIIFTLSKRQPHAELNPAHVPGSADFAECRRRAQTGTGILQVDDVQDVRRFHSELKGCAAGEVEVAEHTQVHVPITRTINDTAWRAAVGSERR